MHQQRTTRLALLSAVLATLVLGVVAVSTVLAHEGSHESADAELPDSRTIRDVYVFESQEDPARLVLAMTVGADAASGQQPSFDPAALYEFKIDTNADGVEDRVVQATFTGEGDNQQVTIHGPSVPEVTGGNAKVVPGETLSGDVSFSSSPTVLSRPGLAVRAFAGLRDDPAFWAGQTEDQTANGTGRDVFAGHNVLAIVVEIRKEDVLAEDLPTIDVWASVSVVGGRS